MACRKHIAQSRKAKQWMQAVSLLLTLQQSGLQADDIAFNTASRLKKGPADDFLRRPCERLL